MALKSFCYWMDYRPIQRVAGQHQINYHQLYMRPAKDVRGDNEVKKEIFQNSIKDKFDILFVVDDRLSVVKMWRSIGLVCLQCDWGDF